jgi:hypothetical protein
MSEPVVLEGRLREAGDGYECSDLYLDDRPLTDVLEAVVPNLRYAWRHWVAKPPYDPEAQEPDAPEPWTPVDKAASDKAFYENDAPFVEMLCLFRDWGRVRITVERLEEPTP